MERTVFVVRNMSRRKKIVISCCSLSIVIASIALIASSFSYIEWNEYGLKMHTTTNQVDYTTVYSNGRYFWGLAYGVVTFVNTATTVDFSGSTDLSIFAENGLELNIDCSFQYRVVKDELPTLYKNYGTSYPTQIVSIAKSLLKNVAPNFTTDEYYQNRTTIAEAMFQALSVGLRAEMNVEVMYLQLRYVTLPDVVLQKLLAIGIQNQTNIKEQYIQQSTVIRQQTQTLANNIIANATVINSTAIAQASYIQNAAQAEGFKIIQQAKQEGYTRLFQELGLNTTELQLAFLYVTSLQENTDANFLVDVKSVIVQP